MAHDLIPAMTEESPHRIQPGAPMPFLDHLAELRVRLLIVIVWALISFVVGLAAAPSVLGVLMRPLLSALESRDQYDRSQLILRVDEAGGLQSLVLKSQKGELVPVTTTTLALAGKARLHLQAGDASPVPITAGAHRANNLIFLSPLEPIYLLFQAAGIIGLVLTIPMAAYQGWLFLAPGLLSQERRVLGWTLLSIVLLFPLGAGFAFVAARLMLAVLLEFSSLIPGLEPSLVAAKGISFLLTMMLVFGVVFEFPLVLVLLSRIGVVSSRFLIQWRKTAIVLLSIIAAIATPSPDPFSMLAMFLPLVVLYEVSVRVIVYLESRRQAEK